MELKTTEDIVKDHRQRINYRAQFETVWQDIFDHFMPRRARITSYHNPGEDRTRKIYDSTPVVANERLAAVLQSTLTNPATQWFILETDDEELNELQETKEWLASDTKALKTSLDASNFYSQAHEMYLDLGAIATGTLYAEESNDPTTDFYFSARHIGELFLSEGDQGNRNYVNLERKMTARQILERWRNRKITGAIPQEVFSEFEKGEADRLYTILQAIFPNPDYDEKNLFDPAKFRFRCEWIFLGEGDNDQSAGKLITLDGYHEFPVMTPCWSRASGEFYGRGPGWTALADAKVLYAQERTSLRVGEKIADPPMQAPSGSIVGDLTLKPGGFTYYDPTAKRGIEPIVIGANYPITLEEKEQKRNSIRDIFFVNQLQLINQKDMTAEEVRARIAENARILGPTFGRLNDEFLEVLVDRCLGILRRRGKLAEVPEAVITAARERGVSLRVRYVSPLVKAQSASEVQGLQQTAQTAFDWAERQLALGNPDTVTDNLDFDFAVRKLADLDGTPPEFLHDKKTVEQIRRGRAEQIRLKSQLENAQAGAEIADKGATAGEKIISIKDALGSL